MSVDRPRDPGEEAALRRADRFVEGQDARMRKRSLIHWIPFFGPRRTQTLRDRAADRAYQRTLRQSSK